MNENSLKGRNNPLPIPEAKKKYSFHKDDVVFEFAGGRYGTIENNVGIHQKYCVVTNINGVTDTRETKWWVKSLRLR